MVDHVVSVRLDKVNKFFTAQKDGFIFENKLMLVHIVTVILVVL
jgi:hypothetical protein